MTNEMAAATSELSVANVILWQLGGNRFLAMTGARNLIGHDRALTFNLPRGLASDGSNFVRITLTPADLYTVETFHYRRLNVTPKSSQEGVYAEDLRAVFTRLTGLDTSLGTMTGGR